MKKRAKKAADIQFQKCLRRRNATKVETERASLEPYEQDDRVPITMLEAVLFDLDWVTRAIIDGRLDSLKRLRPCKVDALRARHK